MKHFLRYVKKSDRYNLKDLSILIPLKVDSKERQEHFAFLNAFLENYFFGYQLIVVEAGFESKIAVSANTQHIFIQEDASFSPAKICNRGAFFIKTPYFCKWDVDAFVDPQAIFDGFIKLKEEKVVMLLPFSGLSFTITEPLRTKVLQYSEEDFSLKFLKTKNDRSTGLIHLFDTKLFKRYGGYNEEFIGWGYEDDEIVFRFQKLSSVLYLEGYEALHLDHPRIPQDPLQAEKNRLKAHLVFQMEKEELLDYIAFWNPFGMMEK